MNKNLESIAEHIQQIEEEGFVYDKQAIEESYRLSQLNRSSLSIRILSILGGFMGTIAFMVFLLITGLYSSDVAMTILGLFFIGGAITIANENPDKLVLDTVSIALYFMGYVLLGYAIGDNFSNDSAIFVIYLIFAVSTLAFTRHFILTFIAVLILNGSLLGLLVVNELYDLFHLYISALSMFLVYIFLNEASLIIKYKSISKLYNPIRIGLMFSYLGGLAMLAIREFIPVNPNFFWISSVLHIAVVLYLIKSILAILEIKENRDRIIIFIISTLLLLLTIHSPAISGSIIVILLCFYVNYKTGLTIGIAASIYFVAQYYYDLNLTLLVKSVILFSSGLLFLLFYLLIQRLRS
jgi:hypothetical protein